MSDFPIWIQGIPFLTSNNLLNTFNELPPISLLSLLLFPCEALLSPQKIMTWITLEVSFVRVAGHIVRIDRPALKHGLAISQNTPFRNSNNRRWYWKSSRQYSWDRNENDKLIWTNRLKISVIKTRKLVRRIRRIFRLTFLIQFASCFEWVYIFCCDSIYRMSLNKLYQSIVIMIRKIWTLTAHSRQWGLKYFIDRATMIFTRNRYQLAYFEWQYVYLLHFWSQRGILSRFCVKFCIPQTNRL